MYIYIYIVVFARAVLPAFRKNCVLLVLDAMTSVDTVEPPLPLTPAPLNMQRGLEGKAVEKPNVAITAPATGLVPV